MSSAAKSIGSKMLLLSENDVRKVLTMADCLQINKKAYMSITDASSKVGGKGNVPTRLSLPGPPKIGVADGPADCTLFKPAAFYVDDPENDPENETLIGMKIISLRSENPKKGLPLAAGTIAVLDADTGIIQAIVSATYLTGCRTAAGSGLATQLARPDLEHLVVFGAGLQAEMHIDAIQTAIGRDIPKITIVNRTFERANKLKETLSCASCDVLLLTDKDGIEKALSTADAIAATTNAATPLFDCELKPGCHINGIGSYTPEMQEIPESAVNRSILLIDTPAAKSVGDLKHLGADQGETGHPITLLGDALGGAQWKEKAGSDFDCTFYKGVGTAIQDVMTADFVVKRARELGIGTEVTL